MISSLVSATVPDVAPWKKLYFYTKAHLATGCKINRFKCRLRKPGNLLRSVRPFILNSGKLWHPQRFGKYFMQSKSNVRGEHLIHNPQELRNLFFLSPEGCKKICRTFFSHGDRQLMYEWSLWKLLFFGGGTLHIWDVDKGIWPAS